jgi:hypothetical protein
MSFIMAHRGVPLHRNPTLRPGLAALVEWLMDSDFNAHAIGRIFDYVAVQGTPTGCPELPAEDEAPATAVFCDGLDAVPYSSDAWTHDDVFLDAQMLADGTHPGPLPMEPPASADARNGSVAALPSISGGSPEAKPFEPSAEDLADFHAWREDLGRRRASADRHSPEMLDRFNLALYGRREPFHA